MKTLFLIRHAKSSWDDNSLADRDRPLSERGQRDLVTMGQRLVERGVKPDLIVSSPAARAIATAEGLAKSLHHKPHDIRVIERLYACRVSDWLDVLKDIGGRHRQVMLVGHNPEMTDFAHSLASEITHLPTCAIAEFAFDTPSWRDVAQVRAVLVGFDYPKKT